MSFASNASIRTKVITAFGFVLVVTLGLGYFAVTELGAVNDRAVDMRDNWLPATRDLGLLAAVTERIRLHQSELLLATDTATENHYREALKTDFAEREEYWKGYAPTVTAGDERNLANAIEKGWAEYVTGSTQMIALLDKKEKDQAIELRQVGLKAIFDPIMDTINKDVALNSEGGKKAANEGVAIYASARTWIMGALGLAALLCLVAGYVIVAGVSGPIKRMTESMSRLAKHDLATAIEGVGRKDEIGQMAGAVQVFKDSMIEGDRLAEQQRAEQAAKERRQMAVDEYIAKFDESVREMLDMLASASTEMSSTAESMAAIAEETSRQATAVSAASEQASTNVQTVASASEEMAASVEEISRQVGQAAETARNAVAEAAKTNATMQGLAEAAQRIGEVVALINDIASQTNLLALNATIEAARAGEAGKGFAVVASEVKALANQTGKATEEISGQITAIQSTAGKAVEAIKGIDSTISQISEISAMIASAVEQQGAATREITRNTQEASSGTKEVTRNISGVNEAATQTGSAATQVLAASGDLGKQAERLRAEVSQFLRDIKAAA